MKLKQRMLVVVGLVALMAAPACGAKARHVAVVADSALYEVLNDVHSAEQTALCGHPSCAGFAVAPTVVGWTQAKSTAFNKLLLPAVEGGRQFNQTIAGWKPGAPMPAEVQRLVQSLGSSLAAVTSDFPDGSTKSTILANIGKAQTLVLNTLAIVLSVKGGV